MSATTVKDIGALVAPFRVAVISVLPAAMPVVIPNEDMVATVVSELAQVTTELISAVEPSEYVPIAVNCWEEPIGKFAGVFGVRVIEDRVGVGNTTAKSIAGLVTPDNTALISIFPLATPVSKPDEDIVATLSGSISHFTLSVMSAVEPSEYVPIAVNCWVEPIGKLFGDSGDMAIEDNLDAVDAVFLVVDEQAGIPTIKMALNPNTKQ